MALCEIVQSNRIRIYDNPCNVCTDSCNYRLETVATDEEDVLVRCLVTYDASFSGAAFKLEQDKRPRTCFTAVELWKALKLTSVFKEMSKVVHEAPQVETNL